MVRGLPSRAQEAHMADGGAVRGSLAPARQRFRRGWLREDRPTGLSAGSIGLRQQVKKRRWLGPRRVPSTPPDPAAVATYDT